jgi:hypothetical protein
MPRAGQLEAFNAEEKGTSAITLLGKETDRSTWLRLILQGRCTGEAL